MQQHVICILAKDCVLPRCAGLVVRQEGGKGQFGALKRAFRLLVEDVDDKSPQDAAYVYSGYAPLSVRTRLLSHVSAQPPACKQAERRKFGMGMKPSVLFLVRSMPMSVP